MSIVEQMPSVLAQDAEAWALRIAARWRMGVEAILTTGQLLLEAKAALPHGAFGQMIADQLPFKERQAQMLMAIASDSRLSNPQYIALLPPSWGTIYDLSRLDDESLDRGFRENIIRPDMERAEIAQLRPPSDKKTNSSDGRADEAMAREVEAGSGSQKGAAAPAKGEDHQSVDQAGMGSERPSPSETDVDAPDAPAAHMAGRVHPAGDHDFSPTPPWATRALVERVLRHAGREGHCKFQTAWEPACGEGHMAEVLREYFRSVFASDIDPTRGYADHIGDFLDPKANINPPADWIITNPPFGDNVLPFMKRALDLAGTGVAMFLQLRYLEGVERYEQIYCDRPPTIVAPFVERVPLLMGQYDPKASTTTAFMWLVWLKGATPQAPFFIPPGCKIALTRPDDADRFTQSPVAKIARATAPTPPQPASPPADADDALDIPGFLRRTA